MKTCPNCGGPLHDVPAEVVAAIAAIEMPRRERQIIDILLASYPRHVRSDYLMGRIYDDEREDQVDPNTIQSQTSKLRVKLRAIGVGIESPRNTGYRLTLPDNSPPSESAAHSPESSGGR